MEVYYTSIVYCMTECVINRCAGLIQGQGQEKSKKSNERAQIELDKCPQTTDMEVDWHHVNK